MVISREEQSQNQQIKRKVEKTSAVWMALNSWAEIMTTRALSIGPEPRATTETVLPTRQARDGTVET